MKFLIAGLGSIGRRHFRNLRALGETNILLYRTHKATLPDDELDGVPVETDLQAALANKPDAVIVSNPTAMHLDVAIPAAEAGCHLFLEKPISHSMERVDQLQDAVAQTGVRVLVGFQFRFHPGLRRVSELLARREIGTPVSVRARLGGVSAELASVGGLSDNVCGAARFGRRGGADVVSPVGLFADAVGGGHGGGEFDEQPGAGVARRRYCGDCVTVCQRGGGECASGLRTETAGSLVGDCRDRGDDPVG
ncbi:MAG: Gfo/Idh/MocA family oxidoreductase [Anaerolineae bacterium]|nr:Gfo/Idh/MocA family oxidoreductase [Anaerolineae bacterium]